MKICFLMYPWEKIRPETDSTLRLVHEAVSRGHTVALATPANLTVRDSVPSAFCNTFVRGQRVSDNFVTFYRNAEFTRSRLPLAGFDAIVVRLSPPLDTIILNFLDSVHQDVFIMNDVNGMRIANNKLYTAAMSGPAAQFMPATHVSKNRDYLERVLLESEHERMVLKPLNGYGGKGVIVVERDARQSFRSLLDFYVGSGRGSNYVILQEYIEGARDGDARILMLNGQPIGAMRRIPSSDDCRSNVHAGGRVEKYKLSKEDKALCKALGPRLVRDGLYFAGLDVINGKLLEVNVMAPGGIVRINKLNRIRLQRQWMDFVEANVEDRTLTEARKLKLREAVDTCY